MTVNTVLPRLAQFSMQYHVSFNVKPQPFEREHRWERTKINKAIT